MNDILRDILAVALIRLAIAVMPEETKQEFLDRLAAAMVDDDLKRSMQ